MLVLGWFVSMVDRVAGMEEGSLLDGVIPL